MRFRLIPALDTSPSTIRFVQAPMGKFVLLVLFEGLLFLHGYSILDCTLLGIILFSFSFFPDYRRFLLVAATFVYLRFHTPFDLSLVEKTLAESWGAGGPTPGLFKVVLLVVVLSFCTGYYYLVKAAGKRWPLNRPLATLLIGYFGLLGIASYVPLPGPFLASLWGFLIFLVSYIWYLGYSLADSHNKKTSPFLFQLGHFQPFWGGTATPFPKGAALLRKIEAKDAEQFAVTQIKGMKLLAWAFILKFLHGLGTILLYGRFSEPIWENWASHAVINPVQRASNLGWGIPHTTDLIHAYLGGNPAPIHEAWTALSTDFFMGLLNFAVMGHVIIAICRMAGYRALRNSYNPLGAKSIADFWNRYYYYFKELLVDFFFYPTYFRYFKKHPRLRIFIATVSAAGFGNIVYHFINEPEYVMEAGLGGALVGFSFYIFYGLLLGTGIGLSQIYNQRGKVKHHWFRMRVITPLVICIFYSVLGIFGIQDRSITISDRMGFVATLVGIQ